MPTSQVTYRLDDVIELLRASANEKLYEPRQLRASVLDQFLFSGRFNSVLGLDGFRVFKTKLKEVLTRVNSDEFGSTLLTLEKMADALLDSGLYYEDRYLPEELAFLKKDDRWLTAYRYIAKNLPDITYPDFRSLVERFKDSRGQSVFVEPNDSDLLRSLAEKPNLFHQTFDVKAALMGMGQKELRAICEKVGIASARTLDETSDRIVEKCGREAIQHVSAEFQARRTLVIKDSDLATGDDIIHLDIYLRSIAKVVRDDLALFIQTRRTRKWKELQ